MKGIYRPIAEHLQQFCTEKEFVIYRDAFRWKKFVDNDNPWKYDANDMSTWDGAEDEVLSNHYDSMELEQLAEDFGYEIKWAYNLKHVAIVSKV